MSFKGTICIVIEIFSPVVIGGAEISTALTAQSLADAGYRVIVLTPHYKGKSKETKGSLTIIRFPYPKKFAAGDNLYFTNPLFYIYLAYQIIRAHKIYRFSLIHAHHTYSIIGSFIAAKFLGLPFYATLRDSKSICIHGAKECLKTKKANYVPRHKDNLPPKKCSLLNYYSCFLGARSGEINFEKKPWFGKFMSYTRKCLEAVDCKLRHFSLRRATEVIAVSNAIKEKYTEAVGISNLSTIYNPPPLSSVGNLAPSVLVKYLNSKKKIVLYVGALSIEKGVQVLVDSMPRIVRVLPETIFVFIGKMQENINFDENLNSNYVIVGHLEHEAVQEYLCHCDLVVVPSVGEEAFGRVALEALVHGRPVVATKNGGLPEIIENGVNGLLVEKGNVEEMEAAIIKVLNSKCIRESFKSNGGRIFDEKFSIRAVVDRYNALYAKELI